MMAPDQDASAAEAGRLVVHARVVTGAGGGPDKTILNSPRFLPGTGYRAICVYLRDPRDPGFAALEERARRWQAPLFAIDDTGPLDWRVVSRVVDLCRRHRPRIWHGHDYKSNLLGLLVRRRHPMALVTTVHGWVKRTWKTPLYYAVDRWCLQRYDSILCVSPDLHQTCLRLGVDPDRCVHVPNAIDPAEFRRREGSATAKQRRGVDPGRILIGAVGRLSREKGFGRVIRAVAGLIGEGLDLELWIAGEGDARAELERLVRELGHGDRIRLLGFEPDPLDLYQALDALVISSHREGLPNVLLEAMALELPVVCTPSGGIATVISDRSNGLLVESATESGLAGALRELATDPDLRARLGSAARATIEESFGFQHRMETVRRVYDRTLNGAPDG